MVSKARDDLPEPDSPGNDGQGVAGDGHVDVAEIVLARAAYRDVCDRHADIGQAAHAHRGGCEDAKAKS